MKRTIQAFLVTSVLLIGCANATVSPVPANAPVSDPMTAGEIREVRENLSGICEAILNDDLPLDREIRAYVRGRTEPVSSLARAGSPVAAATMKEARSTLKYLAGEYSACAPALGRDIWLVTEA